MTRAALLTDVSTLAQRTDVAPIFDTMLRLAEAEIASVVRSKAQEAVATGTLVSESLTAPTGLLEVIAFTVAGKPIQRISWEELDHLKRIGSSAVAFALLGSTFTVLNGTGSTYTLRYIERLPALVNTSDTNAVYQAAPNVYTFAVLKQIAAWSLDTEMENRYAGKFSEAVSQYNAQQSRLNATPGKPTFRGAV